MTHWTQDLKAENAALREALGVATMALRMIPQSRLDKERGCPEGGEGGLAYIRCAEEVDRLGLAALDQINATLAEAGI